MAAIFWLNLCFCPGLTINFMYFWLWTGMDTFKFCSVGLENPSGSLKVSRIENSTRFELCLFKSDIHGFTYQIKAIITPIFVAEQS